MYIWTVESGITHDGGSLDAVTLDFYDALRAISSEINAIDIYDMSQPNGIRNHYMLSVKESTEDKWIWFKSCFYICIKRWLLPDHTREGLRRYYRRLYIRERDKRRAAEAHVARIDNHDYVVVKRTDIEKIWRKRGVLLPNTDLTEFREHIEEPKHRKE